MPEKKRYININNQSENCCTIEIIDEDHTLGNALRYMLIKNPEVIFCGYSMPHPNERKIIMQIQTLKGSCSSVSAFKKSLKDLYEMCGCIKKKFEKAYTKYEYGKNEDEELDN